jgi:phage tail sheath gpL-like
MPKYLIEASYTTDTAKDARAEPARPLGQRP